MVNSPFTLQEDAHIRDMAGRGVFVPEIADALERSDCAVRSRMGELGVKRAVGGVQGYRQGTVNCVACRRLFRPVPSSLGRCERCRGEGAEP